MAVTPDITSAILAGAPGALKGLWPLLLVFPLLIALWVGQALLIRPRRRKSRERIPPWLRRIVWERDGARCVICNSREDLECDHIIPFSKGGATTEGNLQILCRRCNRQKGAHI